MPKDDWSLERARRAWDLRQRGLSYSEIGQLLGQPDDPKKLLSRQAAKRLVRRWQSRIERPLGIPTMMTERAYKVLQTISNKAGEPASKQLAKRLIENGELQRTEYCGVVTFREIREWAYS